MKDAVDRYLNRRLSRRGFVKLMARSGFSLAAVASILDSLAPLESAGLLQGVAHADDSAARIVEGTGGEVLVEQLRAAGVRFLFNCNSSGTYPVFDALVDRPDVQVIQAPHEGQTVAIAQGYALGSGEVAFALNGSVGLPNTLLNTYNAWKDRTPLVIASQREPRGVQGGRDAFEEWDDYLGPTESFTRWRWSVDQPERVAEITRRAFKIASTPPAGPVALAFPLDVLSATGVRAAVVNRDKFIIEPRISPAPALVERAAELLVAAARPVLVVGPEVTRSRAARKVVALAERLSIPVAQGEALFDDFPTGHPLFVGDFNHARHPKNPDLVLSLGARMPEHDETESERAKVVHVSIDADTLARVVPTDVAIVADVKETAADLLAAVEAVATDARLKAIAAARLEPTEAYTGKLRARREELARERWDATPLSWERVAGELDRRLETDAIIVPELAQTSWLGGLHENGALAQFTFGPGGKSRIGRTTGSALGWGVGAAIGIKLARPNRQVIALQGDGGFMFAQAETFWTMARYEVPIVVVIFNNRSYNGPRNKVLRAGGRQAKTNKDMICYLGDPDVDFAKVAAGYGVKGEVVTSPGDVGPAIERALASTREGKPYLIDAVVGRTGLGADSTWYPKYSVAAGRKRKV